METKKLTIEVEIPKEYWDIVVEDSKGDIKQEDDKYYVKILNKDRASNIITSFINLLLKVKDKSFKRNDKFNATPVPIKDL